MTTSEFEPGHNITAFRFSHSDDGEFCAITLELEDERPAQVMLPSDVLTTFENELSASEERCKNLQGPLGESADRAPAPRARSSDVELAEDAEYIHAITLRVTRVSLFEQLDGGAVGIRFDHSDGAATRAILPIDYVPVFLKKLREARAIAQARKGQI